MNRKETTKFLSSLLIREKLSGIGKYWASEVSLDYGTVNVRRIDFLQFIPENQMNVSGIEKGIFISYEVKSCKADFESGFGKNFITEKNYLVTTMETYKKIIHDIPRNVGVLVAVPEYSDMHEEFENPTDLSANTDWKLCTMIPPHMQGRARPMTELLFCMLRSGH